MLSVSIRKFLRDEGGGYTVWSLVWFSLYVAMGGLAVDVSDAYRVRTLLQATADTSALAGAMSLEDGDANIVAQAVAFAQDNMAVALNGHVVDPNEVLIGNWSQASESFTVGGAPKNAVYVRARRADANLNPLATNFLRIIGMDRFNVNVDAVATRYVPSCLTNNGLVAANKADVTSNNHFSAICVHAQNVTVDAGHDYAVDVGNNNIFDSGTQISMSNLDDLNGRPNVCTMNTGLCDPGTLVEGDLWPKDVDNLDAIIAGLTNPASEYMPGYMFQTDAVTGNPIDPTIVDGIDQNYAGPFEEHHVYDVNCTNSNSQFSLPADVILSKVVIVADCKIHSSSEGTIVNSVLATSALGNGTDKESLNAIHFASGWNIGSPDFCTDGTGQVGMYAKASIDLVAKTTIYGLRAVAGGDFSLTAQADVSGISAEAGNNITATANGNFTYCGGQFTDEFVWHYRLVR